MHEHSSDVHMVEPKRTADGRMSVVVVERVEVGPFGTATPDYCVHGKTACLHCDEWCWLGDRTHDVVLSGQAAPLCVECAHRLLPEGAVPTRRVRDHRRADGPHT